MCLPADFDGLTREERLMEMEAVRRHHRELREGAYYSHAGQRAYMAHLADHREAARRLRQARDK